MLTLQLGILLGLGDRSPGFGGKYTEVRLEPQKSWDVTRMETPSKITNSRSKSREADAEMDEDLGRWRDGMESG